MVLIATAGGTSPTLGRAIVTALLQDTDHTPIILSSRPASLDKVWGTQVKHGDYTSYSSLVSALHGVHIVVSVLKIPRPDWALYQMRLLRAASTAGEKRFAPSEFGLGPEANDRVDVYVRSFHSNANIFQTLTEVVAVGVNEDDERHGEIRDALNDVPILCDLRAKSAEHPVTDDGATPFITLARIHDLGRFVAAACNLPDGQWPALFSMAGETVRIAEVTRMMEEHSRKRMNIRSIEKREIQARADAIGGLGSNRDEVVIKMISQIQVLLLEQTEDLTSMGPMANDLLPVVKAQGVREYLEEVFGLS